MKDYSNNEIKIIFDFTNLSLIKEYLLKLKKERDYYKKVVEKCLPLFKINYD